MTARIAVLASGTGSNLQAILDYLAALGAEREADVVVVASDRGSAGALDRARAHGIAALALDQTARTSGLEAILAHHGVDVIALAGYLKFVPPAVTQRWRGRVVNVHPALLPAFGGAGMYGLRVHQAVIASGARVSGATVHFADEEYDRGRIIAQWPVPVLPCDTPERLGARVLRAEHAIYPRVVHAVAAGRITLGSDGLVHGLPEPAEPATYALSFNPGPPDVAPLVPT